MIVVILPPSDGLAAARPKTTAYPFSNGILVVLLAAGMTGVPASAAGAVANWEQANISGFGDPQTGEVTALAAFNGYLYAGNYNPIDPEPLYDGAQIFRSLDGVTWVAVTQPGFGIAHDSAPPAILDFAVFNTHLYASTGRGNAGQIWRTLNGLTWAPVTVTGFSDPDNVDIAALTVFGGMIYAGVGNNATGAQIWRSYSGDNNTWVKVAPVAAGTEASSVTGFAEFDGSLYAAVQSESPAQIWRSYGGALGTWMTVVDDGFGNAETIRTGGLCVFTGYLYAGAGNAATGALLYRTNDGATWEEAISPAFGDPNNQQVDMLYVFQNRLYVSMKNTITGIEIWLTADGTHWEQVNQDGFGDGNNTGSNRSNATEEFMNWLYVGTSNAADGGELWRQSSTNEPLRIVQVGWGASRVEVTINTVPGEEYSIEYSDGPLSDPTSWRLFANPANGAGYWLETGPLVSTHTFVDDFSMLSSGAPAARGFRAYRVRTGAPLP